MLGTGAVLSAALFTATGCTSENSKTTVTSEPALAALQDAPPLTDALLQSIASAARNLPRDTKLMASLDELANVKGDPSLTEFEKQSLALAPTVKRFLELASAKDTPSQKAEFATLVETLRSSDVAKRLMALGFSSAMSCAQFEELAAERSDISSRPEIGTLLASCASGEIKELTGIWSGFANADWSGRIVMPGEEVLRSEEAGKVVSAIAGGVSVAVGAVLTATGVAAPLGGILIAAGASGLAYGTGASDKVFIGTETWENGQKINDYYQKTFNQSLLNERTGCFAELPACSVSSDCPQGSSCSYGCCEALHNGQIAESDGVNTAYLVFMNVPASLDPSDIAIWSSGNLKINDRAVVMNKTGGGATIVATNRSTSTRIGTDTVIGNFYGQGSVEVAERAHIYGDFSVVGTSSVNMNTVEIDGAVVSGAAADTQQMPQRVVFRTQFQDSGLTSIALEPGYILALEPGNYGTVNLKSRSRLVLQPGIYHFDGLNTEPDSALVAPGPTHTMLFVRGGLALKGKIEQPQEPQTLSIVYVGSSVYLTQAFSGVLIAPYAHIDANIEGQVFYGSIWGRSVELHQGGWIKLPETSSFWDLLKE